MKPMLLNIFHNNMLRLQNLPADERMFVSCKLTRAGQEYLKHYGEMVVNSEDFNELRLGKRHLAPVAVRYPALPHVKHFTWKDIAIILYGTYESDIHLRFMEAFVHILMDASIVTNYDVQDATIRLPVISLPMSEIQAFQQRWAAIYQGADEDAGVEMSTLYELLDTWSSTLRRFKVARMNGLIVVFPWLEKVAGIGIWTTVMINFDRCSVNYVGYRRIIPFKLQMKVRSPQWSPKERKS